MCSVRSATTHIIRHILGGVDEIRMEEWIPGVVEGRSFAAVCKEGVRWHVEVAEVNTEYERQREERATFGTTGKPYKHTSVET